MTDAIKIYEEANYLHAIMWRVGRIGRNRLTWKAEPLSLFIPLGRDESLS
jgi:hypothetical protein